jgi:hypothetical protein
MQAEPRTPQPKPAPRAGSEKPLQPQQSKAAYAFLASFRQNSETRPSSPAMLELSAPSCASQ